MSEWHLRKDVTVGNILAALAALAAVLMAWHNLDTRVALLEQATINNQVRTEKDVKRVCARLDNIEALQHEVLRKLGE